MWLGGRARIPPQAVSLWKPALKFPVLWLLIYSPVCPQSSKALPLVQLSAMMNFLHLPGEGALHRF